MDYLRHSQQFFSCVRMGVPEIEPVLNKDSLTVLCYSSIQQVHLCVNFSLDFTVYNRYQNKCNFEHCMFIVEYSTKRGRHLNFNNSFNRP